VKKVLIACLFIFSIVFRLYFADKYFHVDIFSNAGWGEWIANNGTKQFYNNGVWVYSWPTQLPVVNLIYGFCFHVYRYLIIYLLRFGFLLDKLQVPEIIQTSYGAYVNHFNSPINSDIWYKYGFLISIKLMAILGDMLVALVVFLYAKSTKVKRSLIWPLVYLWSPFSIYISAFWGQYEQLSFVLVLVAFLTVVRLPIISPVLFSLSLGVKPTSAIFIPFYVYLLIKNRKLFRSYLIGGGIAVAINIYLVQLFNPDGNWFQFVFGRLTKIVLVKSIPKMTVNSYNLWHMFFGDGDVNDPNINLIFMPFKYWAYLFLAIINYMAIKIDRIKKDGMFLALMVVGIGSWLFGVTMLERYLFAGIAFGLIAAIKEPKLFKPWFLMSLLFWVNLYKHWWQPEWLPILRIFHENYPLASQLTIPLLNIIIFIYMIKVIYAKDK